MGRFRNKSKKSPAIPTAALPDIIFILLFFFMVTTKMRENNPLVNTMLPQASQLKDIDAQKEKVTISIGVPKMQAKYGSEPVIQFDNEVIQIGDLKYKMTQKMESAGKSADNMLVYMKVDSDIQMGILNDVKHELRDMGVRNLLYSTLRGNDI